MSRLNEVYSGARNATLAESATAPETKKYLVKFDFLAFAGDTGTGKTRTAKRVCEKLGIDYLGVGEMVKSESGESVGAIRRTAKQDQEIDRRTEEIMIRYQKTGKPLGVDARLSPILTRKLGKNSVNVLVDAYPDIKYIRAYNRAHEENPEVTYEAAKKATKKKRKYDFGKWKQSNPLLKGQDPFHKDFKDCDGFWMYDIIIDNTDLNVEESADAVIELLIHIGKVEEIKIAQKKDLEWQPKKRLI